jgi:hypothetical protein
MRIIFASIAVAVLSCTAAAQLVSPATHLSTEGNSNNTYPFYGNTFHYQQVQGDIRGNVQIVKQIAFRRDGTISISSAAKTVTAELWMGHGDHATVGTTYANNYDAAGRTQVVPNGPINLPAMPAKPTSPPAAFTAIIPFKTSFIYLGTKDLVWEYSCSASSSTASYIMDAVSSGRAVSGPYTLLGTGCTATGQTRPMVARAYLTTFRSPDRVRYYCYTNYGTKSAAAGILVGLKNPNAAFPICNKILYTNADLVTIGAMSRTNGYFNSTTGLYFPWNAAFAGLKIYSQTYTADAALGPIPVAVSNGVESTIPGLGAKPEKYARIYSYNNHTATSGSLGNGYSIVTQFK